MKPSKFERQSGITLMEVLIYAGLSLALMVLAVSSLGYMQKGATRNQEMARLHTDADEAVRMISQDARNMGLKRIFYSPSAGIVVDTQLTQVDYGVADSSSFIHKEGKPFDSLIFIKPQMDAVGKPTSVDTIAYQVNPNSKTLFRTVNGKMPVEICRQVDGLQFEYGLFAVKNYLLTETPPLLSHWTQSPSGFVSVTGSTLKATLSATGNGSFWVSNAPINLVSGHTYQIKMATMANSNFMTNVKFMYAILCNSSGTILFKQNFLPKTTFSTQYLSWSGIDCSNCFVGFRMEMNGGGEFNLNGLSLQDIKQANGVWISKPTTAQKKAVRAFRIHLVTKTNRAIFGNRLDTVFVGNDTLYFNDDQGRSVLEDVVAIPNNGY